VAAGVAAELKPGKTWMSVQIKLTVALGPGIAIPGTRRVREAGSFPGSGIAAYRRLGFMVSKPYGFPLVQVRTSCGLRLTHSGERGSETL
jgi:hypothetical protein